MDPNETAQKLLYLGIFMELFVFLHQGFTSMQLLYVVFMGKLDVLRLGFVQKSLSKDIVSEVYIGVLCIL